MSLRASTQVSSELNLEHTGFGRPPARLGRLPKPPRALIIPPGLLQRREDPGERRGEATPPCAAGGRGEGRGRGGKRPELLPPSVRKRHVSLKNKVLNGDGVLSKP